MGEPNEGYNGWTNRKTWCVSLWLDNDEWTYSAVRELAERVIEETTEPASEFWTLAESRLYGLEEQLRSYVEELAEMTCPGVIEGASFVADLFQAALGEVNWREVAGNYLQEVCP